MKFSLFGGRRKKSPDESIDSSAAPAVQEDNSFLRYHHMRPDELPV